MAAASGKKSLFFFGGGGGGGGGERVNPRNMITSSDETQLEFQESDVWNSNDGTDHRPAGSRRSLINNSSRKPTRKPTGDGINDSGNQRTASMAASLPVNIPDWSRILGEDYSREHKRESEDDVEEEEDEDQEDEYGRLPPHEYLARIRGSSFSVHEGIGRTLKGRDLSRVRNAVWKQTGFED